MATITLKDFQEFAQPRIVDGFSIPEQFRSKLKEIFDFAVANEAAMDSEANAYFDRLLSSLSDIIEHGLGKVADGPDKRKMLRLVALTRGKHHRADKLAEGLGKPLPHPFAVSEAAKPIFLASLRVYIGVICGPGLAGFFQQTGIIAERAIINDAFRWRAVSPAHRFLR